jgi:hypothetical protein
MSAPKSTDQLLAELDAVLVAQQQSRAVFEGLTKEQCEELLKDLLPSSSRLGRAAMQSAIFKQIEEKRQDSSTSGQQLNRMHH